MRRWIGISLLVALASGCGDDGGSKPEPVRVSVFPDSAWVRPSESTWFHASVTGAADTTVDWSVEGKAFGDSVSGTTTPAGRYTAPASLEKGFLTATVTVTATSRVDPTSSATAYVVLEPGDGTVEIRLSPCEVHLGPAGTQDFEGVALHVTSDSSVVWSLDPAPGVPDAGGIDAAGRYEAPDVLLEPATVFVRATSVEDTTRSAAAIVHLVPLPVEVHLSPDSARVGVEQVLGFEFSVENTSDPSLDWYVNGIPEGQSSIGRIYSSGVYRAPEAVPDPPVVEVRAVSRRDTARFAVAYVEIVAPVSVEAEDMTEAQDRGHSAIGVVYWFNASGLHAVEGLNRMLEWIEIPAVFPLSGAYNVAVTHATKYGPTVDVTVIPTKANRAEQEWRITLNGGGCG